MYRANNYALVSVPGKPIEPLMDAAITALPQDAIQPGFARKVSEALGPATIRVLDMTYLEPTFDTYRSMRESGLMAAGARNLVDAANETGMNLMDGNPSQAADLSGNLGPGDGPLGGATADANAGATGRAGSPARTAYDYVAWLGRAYSDKRFASVIGDPEKAFLAFGKDTGRLLPESWLHNQKPHQIPGGKEWVYRPQNGRIIKTLRPGKGYSMDPLDYVMRIGRMQAAVPKLDYRIEGMVPKGKSPRIVTSMREVTGSTPTKDFLETKLTEYGWDPVGAFAWEHAETGVTMADAAPDNFIQVAQDVVPIDVWFEGDITQPLFTRGLSAGAPRRQPKHWPLLWPTPPWRMPLTMRYPKVKAARLSAQTLPESCCQNIAAGKARFATRAPHPRRLRNLQRVGRLARLPIAATARFCDSPPEGWRQVAGKGGWQAG